MLLIEEKLKEMGIKYRIVAQIEEKEVTKNLLDFLHQNGYFYVVEKNAWANFDISIVEKKIT